MMCDDKAPNFNAAREEMGEHWISKMAAEDIGGHISRAIGLLQCVLERITTEDIEEETVT